MSPVALPLPSPRAIIQSNMGHWAGLRHPSKTESETSYQIVCRSRSRFPIGVLKTGPFWWWVWTLSWGASETVMRFNVDLQSPQILRWMLKRSIAHQHKGHYILQWCLAQNKYSLIKSSHYIFRNISSIMGLGICKQVFIKTTTWDTFAFKLHGNSEFSRLWYVASTHQ